MSVPFTCFKHPGVPTTQPANEAKPKTATAKAFSDCADFTKGAISIWHPKYSLFLQGASMIGGDKGGGYLRGFDTGIGALMIMASPVALALKVGVGIPAAALGAVATAATGVAAGGEAIGRSIGAPSEAKQQREQLTQQFVTRMQSMIEGLPYPQKVFFEKNYTQLITLAAISVAFNSRDLEKTCLRSGDTIVKLDDIAHQDETRKEYFMLGFKMKEAIRSLNLGLDSDHAWTTLMKDLQELDLESDKKMNAADTIKRETLILLYQQASTVTEKISSDEVFKKVWEKISKS